MKWCNDTFPCLLDLKHQKLALAVWQICLAHTFFEPFLITQISLISSTVLKYLKLWTRLRPITAGLVPDPTKIYFYISAVACFLQHYPRTWKLFPIRPKMPCQGSCGLAVLPLWSCTLCQKGSRCPWRGARLQSAPENTAQHNWTKLKGLFPL